jgi:hypothetical protein
VIAAGWTEVKTISEQEVTEEFGRYSKLAHDGEQILVTRAGKPWVTLGPPYVPLQSVTVVRPPKWPDFVARLAQFYPEPMSGPTASELLAADKEDSF